MRFSLLLFCAILVLAAIPTWADSNISYTRTTGSQSFDGQHIGLQLGSGSSSFGGSYDSFSSDASSGTFKTYSLNIGENVGGASWQIFGSITPKQNLYDAQSVGFVVNTQADAQTMSQFGYTRTWHKDGVPQSVNINQNDLLAGLTTTISKTILSANFTKTLYDNDISSLPLRPAAYMPIPGVTQAPQDYPSYWIDGKIVQGLLTWLKVWGSYTRVQYKEGVAGSANSLTGGADATWHSITLSAQYNEFMPANGANNNYISFGAGLCF